MEEWMPARLYIALLKRNSSYLKDRTMWTVLPIRRLRFNLEPRPHSCDSITAEELVSSLLLAAVTLQQRHSHLQIIYIFFKLLNRAGHTRTCEQFIQTRTGNTGNSEDQGVTNAVGATCCSEHLQKRRIKRAADNDRCLCHVCVCWGKQSTFKLQKTAVNQLVDLHQANWQRKKCCANMFWQKPTYIIC